MAKTADPPVKKRRSFFSTSLALPNLPAITPSRPTAVPSRHQVLAALSEPHEGVPSSSRPKREVKQKPVVETKVEATENTAGREHRAGGSASRKRPAARPPSPLHTTTTTTVGRSLRQRNTTPKQTTPASSTPHTSGRSRHAPPPFFKSPSNTLASKHRVSSSVRQGKKADAKTLLFAPPKHRGPAPSKDETAQSINERLSQMMMQSMRATIGGRDEASQRQPVWRDNHTVKRRRINVKLTAPPPPPRRVIAQTARQRAKHKAEDERQAREAEAEAELYEDVPMDADGEPETPQKDKGKGKEKGAQSKKYMTSGLYCQNANAKSPFKLVNQVYSRQSAASSSKRKAGGSGVGRGPLPNTKRASTSHSTPIFPPLPYDHGYEHFFGKEHDFVLPYDIHKEATDGALNDKKKPAPYQKIRANAFPERPRMLAERAICKCDPESGCGENCINRIMSYLCGRECPCGEKCTNRSLAKRPTVEMRVKYTGERGFGLFAMQDIKEGDFVIDYRGEVIALDTFLERLETEYAGVKNFYALAYDQDEVIDAGLRGNDARFINHGCDPNLEVRKYQTIGDGLEEYEIGMWAVRDIKQGQELFYNYNFDWFAEAQDDLRAQCRCGAANCIGHLGRKTGEKNARDAAIEVGSKKAADAARALTKRRTGRSVGKKAVSKAMVTVQSSGAADRAKQTSSARSTKAAAKAFSPLSATRQLGDASSTVDMPVLPINGGDKGHSEWVDISIDAGRIDLDADGEDIVGEAIGTVLADATQVSASRSAREASPVSSESSLLPYQPKDRIVSPDRLARSRTNPKVHIASSSDNEDPIAPSDDELDELQDTESQDKDKPLSDAPSAQLPVPGASIVARGSQAPSTAAAAKRKSGWSNWLRKIAAEKTRTLEEWHEERMKRRRGIAWMNMMIAEYGVAPSPLPATAEAYSDGRKPAGSSGSFANSLAAQGHGPGPEGVKNLGGPGNMYRSENWKRTKEEQMKYSSRGSAAPESVESTSPMASRTPGHAHKDSNTSHAVGPMDMAHTSTPALQTNSSVTTVTQSPADSYPQPGRPDVSQSASGSSSSGGAAPFELVEIAPVAITTKPTWKVAATAPTWRVQSTIPGQQSEKFILPPSTFTPPDNSHLKNGSKRGTSSKRQSPTDESLTGLIPATSISTSARSSFSAAKSARPIVGWSPQDIPPFHSAVEPRLTGVMDLPPSGSSSAAPSSQPLAVSHSTDASSARCSSPLFPTPVSALEFSARQVAHGRENSTSNNITPQRPQEPHLSILDIGSVPPSGPQSASPATIESRQSSKRKAIAKRNGAPMGWVYEIVTEGSGPTGTDQAAVQDDLPRSARRARVSLL